MKKKLRKGSKRRPNKRNETARNKRKYAVRVLLAIALVLLILIGFLLIVQSGTFEKKSEPEYFSLQDECQAVMGNLMHSINNEGECKLRCINHCDIREMNFEGFEFIEETTACSHCGCSCSAQ